MMNTLGVKKDPKQRRTVKKYSFRVERMAYRTKCMDPLLQLEWPLIIF